MLQPRELAAGILIGFLAAGAAAWIVLSFGPLREREDWRTAVLADDLATSA